MEIWEERYTNKHGQKETVKAFQLFQHYLNMFPRDYKTLVQQVYFNNKKLTETHKNSQEFTKRYNNIRKMAEKYDWNERVSAYDVKSTARIRDEVERDTTEFILETLEYQKQSVRLSYKKKEDDMKRENEKVVVDGNLVERPRRPSEMAETGLKNAQTTSTEVGTLFVMKNMGVEKKESKSDDTVTMTTVNGFDYFADMEEYAPDREWSIDEFPIIDDETGEIIEKMDENNKEDDE